MPGLSKQAHGLPRFMLDCGFWRGGKWRKPSLSELGLHTAGVSYCNEHGTDGILPGPEDDLALALSVLARDVKRTVPLLIARRVWAARPDGDYEIVGFLDHNPSREEVTADRRTKAERATKANHQRWHVEKGQPDRDCPLCVQQGLLEGVLQGSSKESCADSIWKEGRMEGTDGWMDLPPPASSTTSSLPPASSEEEEDWATLEARRRLAARTSPKPVVDPGKWVRDVATKIRATEAPPRLTVVRPLCDECDNGWMFDDEGAAVPCRCRRAS